MESWGDLWSPAGVFGVTGTLGVIACRWPSARQWMAASCLMSVMLAAASWTQLAGNDALRPVFAVVMVWGLLLSFAGLGESAESKTIERLPLLWVGLAGLCLLTAAEDLLTLFIGLQVVVWCCGQSRHRIRDARADRATTPGLGSLTTSTTVLSALLLLGFVLLIWLTGSTRVATIAESLQTSYVNRDVARYAIAGGGSRVLTLSIVLIGASLSGLMCGAPFHSSAVDAVAGADPVTAPAELLWPRAATLIVWLKLWPAVLTGSETTAHLLAIVMSAVTFLAPLLQARSECNLVRQWTLLTVAQGGWLLLAVGAKSFATAPHDSANVLPLTEWNFPSAAQGAWLILLADGVALTGLFGVLSALRRRERPVQFVDDFQGLGRFEPIAAGCTAVCLLSLSGAPLLAGFWSRLFVALSALSVRGEWGPPQLLVPHFGLTLLTVLGAVSCVWSASVAGRTLWSMYFALPLGQPRPAGPVSSLFVAILASVLLVGCGVLPGPLLGWLCSPWDQ